MPVPVFPPPVMQTSGGLPAYTLPPSGAAPSRAPERPFATPVHPVESGQRGAEAPFGFGTSGSGRQPFGGSAAPVSTPPTWSSHPRTPDDAPGGPVPQQRAQGTVYGGLGQNSPIDMTMPVSMNPVENSGSLTGHILSQGWDFGPDTNRRSNAKVAVAMLVVLLVLVGASLLFLLTFGSAFTDWISGIFGS
jgi:hypothetical protein